MNKSIVFNLKNSCVLAVYCGVSSLAWAQQSDFGISEIVVTATKMGETSLQDTPIAISAFTAADFDRSGVSDMRDLAAMTPNLVVAQNSAFAQIYIRGIGSNNVFAGADPSSTVHLDGVYLARPAAVFTNFFDVERVEVLRGPQGTLYGRNSVGGTINIISRLPDETTRAKAQITVGNHDLYRGEAYISGGITDTIAASLSVMRSKRDGYFKNIVPNIGDTAEEDTWGVRGQVRITPNENLDLILRGDYVKAEGSMVTNQALLMPYNAVTNSILGDYHKSALDTPGDSDRYMWGISGEINYTVSEALKFKSLTAYRVTRLDGTIDADATNVHGSQTDIFEHQKQFSEELNISGRLNRFGYVLGVYYFEETMDHVSTVFDFMAGIAARPAPYVKTKAWSVYGQANYDLSDTLTLSAGLRYTDEQKDLDQNFDISLLVNGLSIPGFPILYSGAGSYKAWTPKFGLEFRPSDDLMLYGSITRGFKSGGFNFASMVAMQGYDPEYLWSYEVGFKSDFAGRRLRINGSAFYYNYTDLQVQSFLAPGVVDITNAANASVKGVELEFLAHPVAGLELGGSLTYLKAVYKNFTQAPVPTGFFNASGNYLNSAPKWSYTVFGQYTIDLGDRGNIYMRGEYGWKDRQFFTVLNDNIETMQSYGLVNASLGYVAPDDRWQVTLYGRNLANTQYLVSTANFTAVPAGTPGDPRTFGLRVTFQY